MGPSLTLRYTGTPILFPLRVPLSFVVFSILTWSVSGSSFFSVLSTVSYSLRRQLQPISQVLDFGSQVLFPVHQPSGPVSDLTEQRISNEISRVYLSHEPT